MEGQNLGEVLKQRRESEDSVPFTTAETEYGLQEAEGLLVSRTPHYYLVRGQGTWVPVRLRDLYGLDGSVVPKDTPFEHLKHKSVRVKYQSGLVKAYISPSTSEGKTSVLPEMRPSSASPPPLRSLLRLTNTISRDITALSLAQTSNAPCLPRLIDSSRLHLLRKIPSALQELESIDSPKAKKTVMSLKHCLKNLEITDAKVACDDCKVGQSVYTATCGHRACGKCIGKRGSCCGVCRLKYTKIDLKLAEGLIKR